MGTEEELEREQRRGKHSILIKIYFKNILFFLVCVHMHSFVCMCVYMVMGAHVCLN